MKNAIKRTARWIFVSAPGVGVLVVSAGLGVGFAATKDDEKPRATAPEAGAAPETRSHFGPGFLVAPDQDLSDEERAALEKFHDCMRGEVEPPKLNGDPPDPSQMREKMDAAFDKCVAELPDNLRQQFEEREQQMEEYRSCLEQNGVEEPSLNDGPPSEADREAFEKAREACEDKAPEGAGALCIAGGDGPGRPGGPDGAEFGLRSVGPPPGRPPEGESFPAQPPESDTSTG